MNAVMFRGNNQRLNWVPEVGDKVVAVGGITSTHRMENTTSSFAIFPSGEDGARARALEQLGFDSEKRAL